MNGYGLYANIVKPPYTTLTSYDLNKGTIKWHVPLGDDPRLASAGVTGTGTAGDFKFGVIPTATGLVFVAGGDDKLHVYDAANGKEILVGGVRSREPRHSFDVRARWTAVSADDGIRPGRRPEQSDPSGSAARPRRVRAAGEEVVELEQLDGLMRCY